MHWAKTLESPVFLYDSMLLATAAGEASKAVNKETLCFYRLTALCKFEDTEIQP